MDRITGFDNRNRDGAKLKSLPTAERFLKPGVTFEQLNALALQMSDNENS